MTRALPGGRVGSFPASLGPLPSDAFDAWRAFDRAGRRLAGPQKSGLQARPRLHPAGRDCVRPCRPASLTTLSPYLATPSPPSAPSAARAGTGQDPKRVGSLPNLGFARRGRAALSLTATPSPPGAIFSAQLTSGLSTGLPARSGLRPTERGCAPHSVAQPSPGDGFAAWRTIVRAGQRWGRNRDE